jgi:hypothetical protein
MSTTYEVPAGLWLQLWANQSQEETFIDGMKEYVKMYYREFCDAKEIEGPVLQALETLFDAVTPLASLEEVVREAEAEINDNGGIYSEWNCKYHKVQTFEPEEED